MTRAPAAAAAAVVLGLAAVACGGSDPEEPPAAATQPVATEAADPTELVRVPSELTGELGIYVTLETREAVVAMAAAALEHGIGLEVDSGFRSHGFQKKVLEGLLAGGRPFLNAVRWTAPPGYSEHIAGRAVDGVRALPRHALRDGGSIWVAGADSTLRVRPVHLVHRRGEEVLVFADLEPGEEIVVSALQGVTDGMRIRVAGEASR